MPEVTKEVVPEKKVPKVPPKTPEAPPVTGTCWPTTFFRRNVPSVFEDEFSPLLFINLTIKLLISFKCLKFPKKLFQKRKSPRHHPKHRKPHLSQVHVGSGLLQKKCLLSS